MAALAKQIADYNANQASLGPEPQPFTLADAMVPEKPPVIEQAPPRVTGPDPQQQLINNDQAQLQKVRWNQEHPWGTAENHPGTMGKIAHVLSVAANIGGNIVAPGTMSLIPGTQLNMQDKDAGLAHRLNAEIGDQSQNQFRGAEQAKDQEATAEMPQKTADEHSLSGAQARHINDESSLIENPPTQLEHFASDDGYFSFNPKTGEVKPLTMNGQPIKPKQKLTYESVVGPDGKPHTYALDERGNKQVDEGVHFEKPTPAPGSVTMIVPGPDGSQTLQRIMPGQTVAQGAMSATQFGGQGSTFDKAYVQPANATEKSYQMMDHAYQEFENARKQGKVLPTGAQSMLALSTHLSTTFGNVKGARVTKDMIEHHLGARSISDSALVAVQKLTNGDVLSPDQWNAFHDLIRQSRNLSWGMAVTEAARKHLPVDFLPQDLQSRTVNGAPYDLGADGQFHKRTQ